MHPFEVESTLTDRFQTTVPEIVRRALKLGKRDKIRFSIRPDGAVVLSRADPPEQDDPVLGRFLEFLARDIADRPEGVEAIDPGLVERIDGLVDGIEVDLETYLSVDDE